MLVSWRSYLRFVALVLIFPCFIIVAVLPDVVWFIRPLALLIGVAGLYAIAEFLVHARHWHVRNGIAHMPTFRDPDREFPAETVANAQLRTTRRYAYFLNWPGTRGRRGHMGTNMVFSTIDVRRWKRMINDGPDQPWLS